MKMQIRNTDTFENIQHQFNSQYPFLKLEFFSQPHSKGKPTSGKMVISAKRKIGELVSSALNEELEIQDQMTVFQVEKTFEDKFGLHVQVFRKSGRIWLETTATDEWTLISQNEEGKELSEADKGVEDLPDYHEQE
jgi:hypothetical protein